MKKLIISLLFILLSNAGNCCDCERAPIGFNEAKNVFEGEVLIIKSLDIPERFYEITFKISTVLKGENSDTLTVVAPSLNEGACGFPFRIHNKWEVYTYVRDDKWSLTDVCAKTKKL